MNDQTKWIDLLNRAVSEPGLILKAYSAFRGYSLGNQIAAIIQCRMRYVELKVNDTQRRAIVLQLNLIPVFDYKPYCAYREAEFFRHKGIYRSDVPPLFRERQQSHRSPLIVPDEFPVGYSLAGCSPALPASASPTAPDSALSLRRRQELFQPGLTHPIHHLYPI